MSDNADNGSEASVESYRKLTRFRWQTLVIGFVVLWGIFYGALWTFEYTMSSMAWDRVQEARAILDNQPMELSGTGQAWQKQLDSLRQLRRNISQGLLREQDRRQLKADLRERYRSEMLTHDLPDNWQDHLSKGLKNWKQNRVEAQKKAINSLLKTADEGMNRVTNQIETIRSLDPDTFPKKFLPYFRRTRQRLATMKNAVATIQQRVPDQATGPRLQSQTFEELVRFMDQLGVLIRHIHRIQAIDRKWHGWLYAEQRLHDALRIYPYYSPAFRSLGDAHRAVGYTRIADHFYRQAVRTAPDSEAAEWIRDYFNRRAEEGTESNWNRYNRAYTAYFRGNYQRAEDILRQLLDRIEDDPLLEYLATKRIQYIKQGAPPYSKAANW